MNTRQKLFSADSLRVLILSAPLGKLLRHLITACAGWFAVRGIETGDSTSMLGSLFAFWVSGAWSYIAKNGDAAPNRSAVVLVCDIIAAQIVGALSGVLAESGFDANNPSELLQGSAALLFGGNLTLSKLSRPDTEADALKQIKREFNKMPLIGFLALGSSLFALCSCASFTKQDAINYGERVGLAAADTAILLAHMQLASAEAELNAALMQSNAPRAEIAMKRLAVLSAKQALDAATRAVVKRRATLDAQGAKQPRNVMPSSIKEPPARNASPSDAGGASSIKEPASSNQPPASSNTPPPCDEPDGGACALPACLRVVTIPLPASLREALQAGDYGARVAAHLSR